MVTGVYVPRWGVTMEKATVVAWLVKEGEPVAKGQDLVELETEKIVNIVQAPEGGVLRRILVPIGETAAVGALLGVISEPGEAFDLEALRGADAQVADGGPRGSAVSGRAAPRRRTSGAGCAHRRRHGGSPRNAASTSRSSKGPGRRGA